MGDKPAHMWDYWRRKYGTAAALRECYREALGAHPELQAALVQFETAQAALNAIADSVIPMREDASNGE